MLWKKKKLPWYKTNQNTKRNANSSKDLLIFTSAETIDEYSEQKKYLKHRKSLQKQQHGLAMLFLKVDFNLTLI